MATTTTAPKTTATVSTPKPATTTAPASRTVYGTGSDLQTAKNILGSLGYKFIDTGLAGYKAPASYGTNDIVLGKGTATPGNGTLNMASPVDYAGQITQAIIQAQNNRPALPTYDPQADINNINAQYQARANALTQQSQTTTDQGVANLQKTAQDLQPQYQQARNQVDVTNQQSQRILADQMAQQGLRQSGRNTTQQAILGASRTNQIGALNQQEQKMLSDTQFQIDQLKQKGASDLNSQLADLEAQKQQTLMDANQRAFTNNLQLYQTGQANSQQDLQNLISGIQFAYGVSKDQASQLFEQKKFDYQKAQDLADQKFKQAQVDYQKAQDKIQNARADRQLSDQEKQQAFDNAITNKKLAEAKASALSKVAKSSGSGGNTQADNENKMWALFYQAQANGTDDTFLKQNMKNIVTGLGSNGNKIYSAMQDMMTANASNRKKIKDAQAKAKKDADAKKLKLKNAVDVVSY